MVAGTHIFKAKDRKAVIRDLRIMIVKLVCAGVDPSKSYIFPMKRALNRVDAGALNIIEAGYAHTLHSEILIPAT